MCAYDNTNNICELIMNAKVQLHSKKKYWSFNVHFLIVIDYHSKMLKTVLVQDLLRLGSGDAVVQCPLEKIGKSSFTCI